VSSYCQRGEKEKAEVAKYIPKTQPSITVTSTNATSINALLHTNLNTKHFIKRANPNDTARRTRPPTYVDSRGGEGSPKATRRGLENAIFSELKSTTWPLVPHTLDFQYILDLGMKTLTAHQEKDLKRLL